MKKPREPSKKGEQTKQTVMANFYKLGKHCSFHRYCKIKGVSRGKADYALLHGHKKDVDDEVKHLRSQIIKDSKNRAVFMTKH